MGLLILVIVFVGLFVFLFVAAFKQAKKEEQEWEEKKVAHRAWLKKFGYDNSKMISDKKEHFVDLCTEKEKLIIDECSYPFDYRFVRAYYKSKLYHNYRWRFSCGCNRWACRRQLWCCCWFQYGSANHHF